MGCGPASGSAARSSASPETSASRAPSELNETVPEFSHEYTEVEFLLAGTANTYAGPAVGPATVTSSGHRYVTRVLARCPRQRQRFSGRVLIEPFNTTYGVDRDALWSHVAGLLQAQGDGWIVGISVRASSADQLKQRDPQRYAGVDISSNELEWDMLRALGALVKQGGEHSPLHHLPVRHVYLGGYSQSGVDTATFAAAFGARTHTADGRTVYDGFFPGLSCGQHDAARRRRSGTATLRVRPDASDRNSGHRGPTTVRRRRFQLRTIRQPGQCVGAAR